MQEEQHALRTVHPVTGSGQLSSHHIMLPLEGDISVRVRMQCSQVVSKNVNFMSEYGTVMTDTR